MDDNRAIVVVVALVAAVFVALFVTCTLYYNHKNDVNQKLGAACISAGHNWERTESGDFVCRK